MEDNISKILDDYVGKYIDNDTIIGIYYRYCKHYKDINSYYAALKSYYTLTKVSNYFHEAVGFVYKVEKKKTT